MDNLSTIGSQSRGILSKSRRFQSAKSEEFKNTRQKVKLSEINSSRLSRLINGEADLLDDEELEGFQEYVDAQTNPKKLKDELDLDSNLVLSHGVETR